MNNKQSAQFNQGYKDYVSGIDIDYSKSYNNEYLNGMLFAEKVTRCRFSQKLWHRPANFKTSSRIESLFL